MRQVIVPVLVRSDKSDGKRDYFLGKTIDEVVRDARNFGDYSSHEPMPLQRPPTINAQRYKMGIAAIKRGTSVVYYLGTSE